jgi:hypothetical protein
MPCLRHTFLAVLALGLVAAPGAQAKLPKPKSTLIVPGKSIGGVSLNMSESKAKAAWGSGSKCTKIPAAGTQKSSDLCDWADKGNASYVARAHITFLGGKVYFIEIVTAKTTDPRTSKPTGKQFAAWKTAKGIAIGSKSSAVGKAYPAAKKNNSEGGSGWDIITSKAITSFSAHAKVESILMRLPSV